MDVKKRAVERHVKHIGEDLRELQRKLRRRSAYVHYEAIYKRRPKHRSRLVEEY